MFQRRKNVALFRNGEGGRRRFGGTFYHFQVCYSEGNGNISQDRTIMQTFQVNMQSILVFRLKNGYAAFPKSQYFSSFPILMDIDATCKKYRVVSFVVMYCTTSLGETVT